MYIHSHRTQTRSKRKAHAPHHKHHRHQYQPGKRKVMVAPHLYEHDPSRVRIAGLVCRLKQVSPENYELFDVLQDRRIRIVERHPGQAAPFFRRLGMMGIGLEDRIYLYGDQVLNRDTNEICIEYNRHFSWQVEKF